MKVSYSAGILLLVAITANFNDVAHGFVVSPLTPQLTKATLLKSTPESIIVPNSGNDNNDDNNNNNGIEGNNINNLIVSESVTALNSAGQYYDKDAIINYLVIIVCVAVALGQIGNIAISMPHQDQTILEAIKATGFEAWHSYSIVLENDPVATKAVTSATVYTIGDVIAQRTEGYTMGQIDRSRVLRSLLAGAIGHGPLSHYWYQICDGLFENVFHLTQWWSFIPKVMLDQTTWGPFWNNTYILLIGLMKMDSFQNIWADMKRTTIPLIINGLKLWPLAHCITYGIIPIENRLLWVDMVEIVWVTILATQAAQASQQTAHEKHTAVTTAK